MSIYRGNQVIAYLSKKAKQEDSQSSSHWDKYHADFNFKDDEFSGVGGFGSDEKKYTGLRKIIHFLLQTPFRKMGEKFSDFNTINIVAKDILEKQNKGYSLDVLRQVLTLAYLNHKKTVKEMTCVIGDGFATMTSLLLKNNKQQVVLVNLTKTLLVDIYYLKKLLGDNFAHQVCLITDTEDMLNLSDFEAGVVIAIEAKNHQLMQNFPIDLTINVASMQEMNPETVAQYFEDISIAAKKHSSLFYCCNREEKTLPDGTIVKFEDYPWHLASKILTDELCPWHQKFYNLKPPFYHHYDGAVRHRLVEF